MKEKLNGVYLVLDPKQGVGVFPSLAKALKGGLSVIQIWNNWSEGFLKEGKVAFIGQVKELVADYGVPVLMHDDWQLALETQMSGVHFDEIPENWETLAARLANMLLGLTVGNDMGKIRWADAAGFSYISFCAMFPSPSVASCEIVQPETVVKTREETHLPIFLSGGIRPENFEKLRELDFQGVAVISGIMSAEDPERAVQAYVHRLKERTQ